MIGRCNDQSLVPLLRFCGNIVNDVSTLRLNVVSLQVSHRRDIGVCCLAVIALVIVVSQDLPVIVAVHLPGVVEDIFIEVEVLVLLLGVGAGEVVLPRHLRRFFGVKVDPDEAIVVNVGVDVEKPILGFVEALELLVAGSFCQVAAETVRPAMISGFVFCQYIWSIKLGNLAILMAIMTLLTCKRISLTFPSPHERWDRHGACRYCGRR